MPAFAGVTVYFKALCRMSNDFPPFDTLIFV